MQYLINNLVGAQAPATNFKDMEPKEKQSRKAYKKHSEDAAQQKMFTFRLDCRLLPWLNSKPNKGRYINDLIAADMRKAWVGNDTD